MNELFAFVDILVATGWIYLSVMLVVAVGLLIFDPHPIKDKAHEAAPSKGRSAA